MSRTIAVASPLSDRRAVGRLAGWSALGAAPALVSGRCVELSLDHGFLAGRTLIGIAWLLPMAVAGLLGAFSARRVTPLIGACVEPFRDRLVRHVVAGELRAATSPLGRPDPGAVARLVGQTDTARDISASLLGESLSLAATLTMAVVGLAALDPLAAVLVVAPVVVTAVAVWWMLPALARRTRHAVRADEAVAASVTSTAIALRDIIASGGQARAFGDVQQTIDARARANLGLARTTAVRTTIGSIGGNAPLLLLLAATPWLVGHGRLTVGGVLGAVVYVSANLQPALHAAIDTASVSMVRLRVVLRNLARSGATPGAATQHTDVRAQRAVVLLDAPDLRVEGLSFAHGAGAHPIVDGLDLTIAFGRHIAVVGPSGVGKSTLVDLLAGLTPPDRGRVSIGGVPLDQIPSGALRRLVTIVPQEAYVFAASVRDNLAYLRPEATDAEVLGAADATGLRPVIERLGGLDAELDDPDRLSEGERQLIVVTRAWLSPAVIVILDEATCRLDPQAEARAESAFRRRRGTLVVVAHRISSAHRADEVLVMDGGSVAIGRHEDLLRISPTYAELVCHWDHSGSSCIPLRAGDSV
jgi:ATP-binding cassette subfamily C protein